MPVLRSIFNQLSSLRFAVVLLVLLTMAMATGTVLESSRGSESARRLVYDSTWFAGALLLLGASVLCAMLKRLPWKRRHLPFLMAHLGILLLLLGAAVTNVLGVHGRLTLAEGQATGHFETTPKSISERPMLHNLGFQIRLIDFGKPVYGGTQMASRYFSEVEILHEQLPPELAIHRISMNSPLKYKGFQFLQSSYGELGDGTYMSVLSVSSDPGTPLVCAGFILIVLGTLLLFCRTPLPLSGKEQAK